MTYNCAAFGYNCPTQCGECGVASKIVELILVRGLPGSGKSTFAKKRYPDYVLCEADHFQTDADGIYRYERSLAKEAHALCLARVKAHLAAGRSVVVANTFTTHKELEPYLAIGHIPTNIWIMQTQFKSIHGVPDQIIAAMRARWED